MRDLFNRIISIKEYSKRTWSLRDDQYILPFNFVLIDKSGKAFVRAEIVGF